MSIILLFCAGFPCHLVMMMMEMGPVQLVVTHIKFCVAKDKALFLKKARSFIKKNHSKLLDIL